MEEEWAVRGPFRFRGHRGDLARFSNQRIFASPIPPAKGGPAMRRTKEAPAIAPGFSCVSPSSSERRQRCGGASNRSRS